jgi:hypothetical protein
MRRIKIIACIAGLTLGLISCKKEKVDILETNSPVFVLNGEFNGEDVELTAGDDGVFMYTYTEVVNGVDMFSGSIGTSNEYVSLSIYNGNIDFTDVYLEDVLATITPQFSSAGQTNYTVNADDFINFDLVEEVKWYLNGIYQGVNSFEINEPGKYEICGEIKYLDQTTDTLCNEVIVGYAIHASSNLTALSQAGYVNAQILETGVGISKVNWFVDGQSVGSGNTLYHFIGDNTKELKAEIQYANGIVRTKSMLVNGYEPLRNVLDFSLIETQQGASYNQDYKVLISYMKDGIEYRSDLTDNGSSLININSFEFYSENENGKNVYKLGISVTANLKSLGSSTLYPLNFDAVFGIEIE